MIGSFLDDESIPETSKTIKQLLILFETLSAWVRICTVRSLIVKYLHHEFSIIPHKTTPLTSLNPLRT